jgi:DNA repair protein RecO (recombination protein O)
MCSSPLKPQTNFFSPHEGGTVCPSCTTSQAYPLSMESLKVLRFLERVNLDTALRLRLGPELSSEVESRLRCYIDFVLQRKLNLPQWLNRLREVGIYSP